MGLRISSLMSTQELLKGFVAQDRVPCSTKPKVASSIPLLFCLSGASPNSPLCCGSKNRL
uniref:Uncharacterized protein n=1 Tax=Anguilla anguilla TaxID=7936 RepID=A0A0E9XYL9_ANGAN